MTDREEDLVNLTHKGVELPRRVYLTLTDERKITRAVARLVTHLHERGILSEVEIDDMLLEAAGKRPY
jgi:hypothetical protein